MHTLIDRSWCFILRRRRRRNCIKMCIMCAPCTKLRARNRFLRGSLDLEKFIMKKRRGGETFVLMILFRVACETAIFFYTYI